MGSGSLAIGKGFRSHRAAGAAVVVQRRAAAGGGAGQVGVAGNLLVKHMGRAVGGDGLIPAGAADGAGVVDGAGGGVGGRNRHRAPVRDMLRVGSLCGDLNRSLGGSLSRSLSRYFGGCFHRGLLGRNKPVSNGAAVVIDGGIGILGGGVGRGIHADQAGAAAAHQPSEAGGEAQLIGHIARDLGAHAAVVHQGGEVEFPAGMADYGSRLHIAAGGNPSVGADAGEQQIIGIAGIHHCLNHGGIAPPGIGGSGVVHAAAGGGVHRLHGAGVYDQLFTAAGKAIVAFLGAAVVDAAVEGVFIASPASGKINNVVEAFLRQGEIPFVHLAAKNGLPLFIGESCRLIGVDIQGDSPHKENRAEQHGQHFFKYSLSHRVQLLSHAAFPAAWYLHYT